MQPELISEPLVQFAPCLQCETKAICRHRRSCAWDAPDPPMGEIRVSPEIKERVDAYVAGLRSEIATEHAQRPRQLAASPQQLGNL